MQYIYNNAYIHNTQSPATMSQKFFLNKNAEYFCATFIQYYWLCLHYQNVFLSWQVCAKQAVKITRVPQQRTSIGWFYNKLIKGRGLPWPHALLLVDERHKQWRWSREVSLYDGSVKRLSLKETLNRIERWPGAE